MEAVGQVCATRYVHRIYQESHVRIRLVAFSDPSDPDTIAGAAVDVRFGDPLAGVCDYDSQVFGNSHAQFLVAAEVYKRKVLDYVTKGIWK
jgi:hypothetical protein